MKLLKLLKNLENFFLPQLCIICRKENYDLCPSCRLKIKEAKQFCPVCNKQNSLGLLCNNCRSSSSLHYDGLYIYSLAEQKIVENCIKAIKNHGLKNIATILGKLIFKKIHCHLKKFFPDETIVLIPWPINNLERRRRAYNQNEYLVQGFNYQAHLKYDNCSLTIKRKSKKLLWRGDKLSDYTVIIISDILPENSLINMSAQLLKELGAKKMFYIALSS